jgi:hypothetical protein
LVELAFGGFALESAPYVFSDRLAGDAMNAVLAVAGYSFPPA